MTYNVFGGTLNLAQSVWRLGYCAGWRQGQVRGVVYAEAAWNNREAPAEAFEDFQVKDPGATCS